MEGDEAHVQCDGGSTVVCGQVEQQASTSSSKSNPHLQLDHPRCWREGESHLHVGSHTQTCRHGGYGTVCPRPARLTLTPRRQQTTHTPASHSTPSWTGCVLWEAAALTGMAVSWFAKVNQLKKSEAAEQVSGSQDPGRCKAMTAAPLTHLSVDGEVRDTACQVMVCGPLAPPMLLGPWR